MYFYKLLPIIKLHLDMPTLNSSHPVLKHW